jgi:hypothetical protein
MTRLRPALPLLLLAAALSSLGAEAADAPRFSDAEFGSLHALIEPGPGESRWMEIDWFPSVWEGRRVAAAEGKPILLMAGSGGAPCAGC